MVLNYKLRKKNMEYDYKREVMDRLGIAILDERTMIDSKGAVVGTKPIDITADVPKGLPESSPGEASGDKPDSL